MTPLSSEETEARLTDLPEWTRVGETIERRYEFVDFAESIAFVNRVAALAEDCNHHPDLAVSWNVVTLWLTTPSEGGLTENDFELARGVDGLT
jgi:4a-hydroxytetrahydrobiopterin dehydratase